VIVSILYDREKGKNHRAAKDLIQNGVVVNGRVIKPLPLGKKVKIPFGPHVIGHGSDRKIVKPGYEVEADVYEADVEGVHFNFLYEPELGNQLYPDALYPKALRPYENFKRDVFLSRGALEILKARDAFPDFIEGHDWMTSFIPAYLKVNLAKPGDFNHAPGHADYRDDIHFRPSRKTRTKSGYYAHNSLEDYQQSHFNVAKVPIDGQEHSIQLFALTGMAEEHYFGFDDPLKREHINLARGGIFHTDAMWNPSLKHGNEMLEKKTGDGLQDLFQRQLPWVFGISNLVFLEELRREIDSIGKELVMELEKELEGPEGEALKRQIEDFLGEALHLKQAKMPYSPENLKKNFPLYRTLAKRFYQKQLGMRQDLKAVVAGLVGRIARQKGVLLLSGIVPNDSQNYLQEFLRQNPAAQIFVGGPLNDDPEAQGLEATLNALKADPAYVDRVGIRLGTPEKRIFLTPREILMAYLAMDIFLMPSEREPGGITQIEALAAAVLLVVAHHIGGIADTIQPFDETTKKGNGVFFEAAPEGFRSQGTTRAFFEALSKAVQAIKEDHSLFGKKSLENAFEAAGDWSQQAPYYLAMLRYRADAWLEDDPQLGEEKEALRKIQVGATHMREILDKAWDKVLSGTIELAPLEEVGTMGEPARVDLVLKGVSTRLDPQVSLLNKEYVFLAGALHYYELLEPAVRSGFIPTSETEKDFVEGFRALAAPVGQLLASRTEMRSEVRLNEIRIPYPNAGLKGLPAEDAEALLIDVDTKAIDGLSNIPWRQRTAELFNAEEIHRFETEVGLEQDFDPAAHTLRRIRHTIYDRSRGGRISIWAAVQDEKGREHYFKSEGITSTAMEKIKAMQPLWPDLVDPSGSALQISMGNQGDLPENFTVFSGKEKGWDFFGANNEQWEGKDFRALVEFEKNKRALGKIRLQGKPGTNKIDNVYFQALGDKKFIPLDPMTTRFILVAYVLGWGQTSLKPIRKLLAEQYSKYSDLRHIFAFPFIDEAPVFYRELLMETPANPGNVPTKLQTAFRGGPVSLWWPENTKGERIGTDKLIAGLARYGYRPKRTAAAVRMPGDYYLSPSEMPRVRLIFLPAVYPVNTLAMSRDGDHMAVVTVPGRSGSLGVRYQTFFRWTSRQIQEAFGWKPYALFALDNGFDPNVVRDPQGAKQVLVRGKRGFNAALNVLPRTEMRPENRFEIQLEETVSAMEKEFGLDPRDHDRLLSLLVPAVKDKGMRRILALHGASVVKLAANQYAMQNFSSQQALEYQLFINQARRGEAFVSILSDEIYQAYVTAVPNRQPLAKKTVVLLLLALAAEQGNWTKIYALLHKRFEEAAQGIVATEEPIQKQSSFDQSFLK